MAFGFPQFHSRFLRTVAKSLDARSKSLRHRGRVSVDFEHDEGAAEWLYFKLDWLSHEDIEFVFRETHTVRVIVYAQHPDSRRWKTFCDAEFGPLFSHAELLQEAFEKTVELSHGFVSRYGESPEQVRDGITARWRRVQARVNGRTISLPQWD